MKKNSKYIKIALLIILPCLSIYLISHNWHMIRHINTRTLSRYINRHGKFAALVFLVLYGIKPIFLVIPSSLVSITGGVLFKPLTAFVLNMAGFFLSGTLAFFLSRFLGKEFVDKIVKGKALKLDENIEKNGFKILFLLRLPPIFHFDIVSYTAGLSKVKYRDFILGSLLGVMPETLCYSFLGSGMKNPRSHHMIIPLVMIVVVTVVTIFIFKKNYDGNK